MVELRQYGSSGHTTNSHLDRRITGLDNDNQLQGPSVTTGKSSFSGPDAHVIHSLQIASVVIFRLLLMPRMFIAFPDHNIPVKKYTMVPYHRSNNRTVNACGYGPVTRDRE